jgi:hypothetical protein
VGTRYATAIDALLAALKEDQTDQTASTQSAEGMRSLLIDEMGLIQRLWSALNNKPAISKRMLEVR